MDRGSGALDPQYGTKCGVGWGLGLAMFCRLKSSRFVDLKPMHRLEKHDSWGYRRVFQKSNNLKGKM